MAKSKEVKKKDKKSKKVDASVKSKSKKTEVKTTRAKKAVAPITEKFTQSSFAEAVATMAGVEIKDAKRAIKSIESIILGSLIKKGRGEFVWPTLFKVVTKHKPATKARKGINPFTKEECTFKAKPATTLVKIRPLGKVKKAAKNEL